MQYTCDDCDWTGTWDEMILETLCPLCRGDVKPLENEEDARSRAMRRSQSMTIGAQSR